jgi:pentatricopeptide repeat protein
MLGTEYSWLISISAPADGTPRVRLASPGLLTIAVGVFCLLCVSLRAEPAHRQLMREATAAAKAGDIPTVIAKLESARSLRPDYPRVLNNLVRFYIQAGRFDEAMARLGEMAAMGLQVDVADDEAFAKIRERADFPALARALTANDSPSGDASVAWEVPGMTGIVEGFAVDPTTRESFFSDVRNRCIWYRDASGKTAAMKKFSTDADGLLGVFALKIDAGRNLLWASSSAVPEMAGYIPADRGKAFLAAYALKTRRLVRTYALPADDREHVLGDFAVAADGTVYAADSTAPVIWRLAPDGSALEKWLESDEFISLQGIAFGPTGRELYVSDYANGLWRIELTTRNPHLLVAPAHTTLFGIDGIYAVPGGLIAVQNGINPQRVVRIALDAGGAATAVHVLSSGHPSANDLALGQVIDGRFDFVGNSGWALFEKTPSPAAPRTVTIFSTPLE